MTGKSRPTIMRGIPLNTEQRKDKPVTQENTAVSADSPLGGVALARYLRRAERDAGNKPINHARELNKENDTLPNIYGLRASAVADPVARSFMSPLPREIHEAGENSPGSNVWREGVVAYVHGLIGDEPYPKNLREFRTLIIQKGMGQKIADWQAQAKKGHAASGRLLETAGAVLSAGSTSATSDEKIEPDYGAHVGDVSELIISTMVDAQIDPGALIDKISTMSHDKRDADMRMLGALSRQFSGAANVLGWDVDTDTPLAESDEYVDTNLPYVIAGVEKTLREEQRKFGEAALRDPDVPSHDLW